MQVGEIGGNSPAQVQPAEVFGIEGLSLAQGGDGRLANESRCRLIGFSKPEGENVVPAGGCIGHCTNEGGREPGLNIFLVGNGGRTGSMHRVASVCILIGSWV